MRWRGRRADVSGGGRRPERDDVVVGEAMAPRPRRRELARASARDADKSRLPSGAGGNVATAHVHGRGGGRAHVELGRAVHAAVGRAVVVGRHRDDEGPTVRVDCVARASKAVAAVGQATEEAVLLVGSGDLIFGRPVQDAVHAVIVAPIDPRCDREAARAPIAVGQPLVRLEVACRILEVKDGHRAMRVARTPAVHAPSRAGDDVDGVVFGVSKGVGSVELEEGRRHERWRGRRR